MSTFTNSEQLYGVKTLFVSGGYVNVTTGQGVYFSLTSSMNSGITAPQAGIITVYDAVSGVTTPHATANGTVPKLYDYTYLSGNAGAQAPDQWQPQPFLSGLNVLISGSTSQGVTISYRLGL